MAPLIKQLGKSPEMTVAQMARERDLIDQINRRFTEMGDQIALLVAFSKIGRLVCAGRCGTNGTGGISFSEVVGATVSVASPDLRITFDKVRPTGTNGPTYHAYAVAFTAASARFYHDSSVAAAEFCEIRLRDGGGGLVNVATTAVNLALFVLDRD